MSCLCCIPRVASNVRRKTNRKATRNNVSFYFTIQKKSISFNSFDFSLFLSLSLHVHYMYTSASVQYNEMYCTYSETYTQCLLPTCLLRHRRAAKLFVCQLNCEIFRRVYLVSNVSVEKTNARVYSTYTPSTTFVIAKNIMFLPPAEYTLRNSTRFSRFFLMTIIPPAQIERWFSILKRRPPILISETRLDEPSSVQNFFAYISATITTLVFGYACDAPRDSAYIPVAAAE